MKSPIIVLCGLIAILLVSGCTTQLRADDTGWTPKGVSSIVNASNQFALDFYSNIRSNEQGNIFYSPYSISTALAMTYEGAKGETAEEIRSVFHLPDNDTSRRASVAALYNRLNPPNAPYRLSTANALWAQEDYSVLEEYTDTVENYYSGRATNLDFVGKTEESRQTINTWVEEQTNDKIKDLFPPGTITIETRLVLTNAIYFRGTWAKQFEESNTKEEDFRISSDQVVRVPMMSQRSDENMFNYLETENLQMLEMPYEGDNLSMLILLPKDDDLESLEESLTLENLSKWKSSMHGDLVYISIPRFTFESKYIMNENLKEMGMPKAFSQSADFSGMTGERDLCIGIVVHQAFVDVNEEGTEAAAATGVSMILESSPRLKVFRADHPFVFIIQERDTGMILFLGRVIDPR